MIIEPREANCAIKRRLSAVYQQILTKPLLPYAILTFPNSPANSAFKNSLVVCNMICVGGSMYNTVLTNSSKQLSLYAEHLDVITVNISLQRNLQTIG